MHKEFVFHIFLTKEMVVWETIVASFGVYCTAHLTTLRLHNKSLDPMFFRVNN